MKDYAKISKNLAELTSKNVKFHWDPIHEEEYQRLKTYLFTEPILLQYPNFEKPFQLTTDASDYAVGAVLTQEVDGFKHPVAYFSKKLDAPELKYSTFEE